MQTLERYLTAHTPMYKILAILAGVLLVLSVALTGIRVHAQIIPAQNQVIPGPYPAGFIVSTSSSQTHKLGGTSSPFFANFTFGKATGTSATTTSFFSTVAQFFSLFLPNLATPAGSFLAVDANGLVIATTSPTGGGGTPAAPDTSVQFNDGGVFGGDANFTFNKTTNVLTIEDISGIVDTIFTVNAGATTGTNEYQDYFLSRPDRTVADPSVDIGSDGKKILISNGTLTVTNGGADDTANSASIDVRVPRIAAQELRGGPAIYQGGEVNVTDETDYLGLFGGAASMTGGGVFSGAGGADGATFSAGRGQWDGVDWVGGTAFIEGGINDVVGAGGPVVIAGGSGGATSGSGGSISLTAGGAQGGDSDGGSVTISPGADAGAGSPGFVRIQDHDGANSLYIQNGYGVSIQTGGTGFNALLNASSLSADRTFTFPDESGTFCLVGFACDGGGTWPWDITTNFDQVANSTTTQEWFRGSPVSLSASSTAWFDQIQVGSSTSSTMATSTFFGNVRVLGTIQAGPGTSYLHTNGLNVPATGFIDFGGGDAVLTHSTGNLTLSAGDRLNVTYASTTAISAIYASSTTFHSFFASSSVGTTTNATSTNLSISGQIDVDSLTSALVLAGATGILGEYTGIDCTNQFVRDVSAAGAGTCATVTASDVDLADLTATDSTLTFSGAYDGQVARTVGINLTNPNTWTGLQQFSNASSTLFSAGYASTTNHLSYFASSTLGTTTSATTTNFAISSIASGRIPFSSTGGNILSAASLLFDSVLGKITATYASTTGFSSSYASSTFGHFGRLFIPPLATPAGAFLAINPSGEVIATTSPTGGTPSAVQTQYASSTGASSNVTVSVEANDVVTFWLSGQRNVSTCDNSNGPRIELNYRLSNFAATTTLDTATDRDSTGSAGCSASTNGQFTATTTGTLYVEGTKISGDRTSLIVQKVPSSLTGASATVQGTNGQMQYNNNGVFGGAATTFWDNTTSFFGIGSSTPWGKLSVLKDNGTSPAFAVGTTTGPNNALFQIFSTTTAQTITSSLSNFVTDIGTRVGIGTFNYSGFGGLLDHFTVRGRVNTEGWLSASCDSPGGLASVAADTVVACPGFGFAEDTNGSLVSTATTNGGYAFGRLEPAVAVAAEGTGVWLAAPSAGFLIAATSTPVLEATARLASVQNATSSNYFIGFTNVATGGTAIDTLPTAGCFFTASSTQANWRAVCRTALATGTYQDTGIASSTVLTGTGAFKKFRIEMDSTTARFYIQLANGNLVKTNEITHSLTTQTMNAGIHIARPLAGLTAPIDFFRLRVWWRDFVPAL